MFEAWCRPSLSSGRTSGAGLYGTVCLGVRKTRAVKAKLSSARLEGSSPGLESLRISIYAELEALRKRVFELERSSTSATQRVEPNLGITDNQPDEVGIMGKTKNGQTVSEDAGEFACEGDMKLIPSHHSRILCSWGGQTTRCYGRSGRESSRVTGSITIGKLAFRDGCKLMVANSIHSPKPYSKRTSRSTHS